MGKVKKNKKILFLLGIVFVISIATIFTACKQNTYTKIDAASYQKQNEVENDEGLKQDKVQAEKAEPSIEEINIVMAGDMLLHDRINLVCSNGDGSYTYDAIFKNVKKIIKEADVAIANQEVIIGGAELGVSGYPNFNAPYEFADALNDAGFDVVCQGTNHALDRGEQGIINCLNYWNNNYPQVGILGINDSEDDKEQLYIWQSTGGTKIAILNYTFGTNGISTPEGKSYLVDYLDEEKVKEDLQKAECQADYTIVCPHWGTEYSLTPDSSQEKWAKIFVEGGADLIIGTHPHVLEPMEKVTSEDGTKSAICFYSLGNFVNWTSGEGEGVSNRMVGGLANITLKVIDSDVEIEMAEVIPIVSHVSNEPYGVTVYKLEDYTDELAEENAILSQAPDFSLKYCNELVTKVLGQ